MKRVSAKTRIWVIFAQLSRELPPVLAECHSYQTSYQKSDIEGYDSVLGKV